MSRREISQANIGEPDLVVPATVADVRPYNHFDAGRRVMAGHIRLGHPDDPRRSAVVRFWWDHGHSYCESLVNNLMHQLPRLGYRGLGFGIGDVLLVPDDDGWRFGLQVWQGETWMARSRGVARSPVECDTTALEENCQCRDCRRRLGLHPGATS